MVLKNVFTAMLCTLLLAWSGLAVADDYSPDQLLGLDLSKAVLSPRPLGPPSEFAPVPIDASIDRGSKDAQARVAPKAEPKPLLRRTRVAHGSVARTTLRMRARKNRAAQLEPGSRNATAIRSMPRRFDTRIQVWPCKSGGICNWKQQQN